MSGPKRTIYSGGHNQIGLIAVPLIHKDNVRIDIDKYPDARREIEDVFRHFQARLREQKNSAGRKELGPILDSLRKGCVLARVRLSEPWQGLSGIEALQVNGAITEILSEVGLPLDYLRTALKDAERSLPRKH